MQLAIDAAQARAANAWHTICKDCFWPGHRQFRAAIFHAPVRASCMRLNCWCMLREHASPHQEQWLQDMCQMPCCPVHWRDQCCWWWWPVQMARLLAPGLASAPPSMTGLACAVLEEIGGFSKDTHPLPVGRSSLRAAHWSLAASCSSFLASGTAPPRGHGSFPSRRAFSCPFGHH